MIRFLAKWISQQLGDRGGFTMPSRYGPRRLRLLDFTAPICVTCNRWLAVLENDTRPVLAPLISVTTALILDLWSGKPVIPTGFYYDFRLRCCSHEGQIIWLGAYCDWHAAWAWHDGLHVGISADEPQNVFVSTFTAFRVVFQVTGTSIEASRSTTDNG